MTAKMTDDELRLDGFLRAKAIYLPQIQQLQGEIERLKEYEWKYKELSK